MTWPAAEFGDAWAWVYDAAHDHLLPETDATVSMLRGRLTAGARVLELGVGTGRLAIPLARSGLEVVGVDASRRMLEVLAAKADSHLVQTVLGDMARPPVRGHFDMVLLAFNTLFALPSATRQAMCLHRAARLLSQGGQLVVDAAIPQPWRLAPSGHDPSAQTVTTSMAVEGVGELPLKIRYAHPPEIDKMAARAGLVRTARFGGWDATPLAEGDVDSAPRHISLYRHPPTAMPADDRSHPEQT